jgi:hypothetical protein
MKSGYLDLLRRVGAQRPAMYVFGGFAEDALLYGKTSRRHEDVDVLVIREDLDRYVREFQAAGFQEYHVYLEDPNGLPTVLHSEHAGLAIELCVFDRDEDDRVYFDIFGDPDETHYRIFLPDDTFTHKPVLIDGVELQTVSPLALYQLRAGLGITNSFGGLREKDIKAQQALRAKYFTGVSEDELRPSIEVQQA